MSQVDLTRQRLIRAALELFTTTGYDVTTTAQIAKKAGVAEGTIYRHFASKQHLLNELYRGAARWATKFVQDAAAAAVPPRDRFQQLGLSLVQGTAREPAVGKLFFVADHRDLLDRQSLDAAQEFRTALEGLVAQGKATGAVRAGAADIWATIWLAVVTTALARVASREWGESHAGVRLALEGAWGAIANG